MQQYQNHSELPNNSTVSFTNAGRKKSAGRGSAGKWSAGRRWLVAAGLGMASNAFAATAFAQSPPALNFPIPAFQQPALPQLGTDETATQPPATFDLGNLNTGNPSTGNPNAGNPNAGKISGGNQAFGNQGISSQGIGSLTSTSSGGIRGADGRLGQGERTRSFEIQLEALDTATSPPVVTAIATSIEGRFLAAAGDDHAIRIIDVTSGQIVQTVVGHVDWVQSLAFFYDSQEVDAAAPVLYSSGNDGRVLEWQYEYPVKSREILRLPYAVRSLSISSQKRLMAIGGFSEEILIWDLANNRLLHRFDCHCGDQRCVRFSPDGNYLLCAGRDGNVHVWETATGREVAEYKAHRDRIHTAAFSKDGSRITSAGADRQLVRFDLTTGQMEWKREIGKSKMMSMCLINEDMVAVAGADNKIRLFDAMSDGVVAELSGHVGSVAVMTQCGEFLASGSFDTTVRIWDLQAIGARQQEFGKPVGHAPLKMDAELQIR